MKQMKLNLQLLGFFILFLVFIAGPGNILAEDHCTCDSGNFVKFEWVEAVSDFLPEGDDKGITINFETNDEGDPICVTWLSSSYFVENICIKAGINIYYSGNYEITNYIANIGQSGTNCIEDFTVDKYAISHIVFCLDGHMPVEMTSFTATINNDLASLEWETATEVNNYGFEVQRSTQPNEWYKIGFVEGHGNSNSPKYYSFADKAVSQSGSYFYRLKQIDIDGSYEYSDAVEIMFSAPDQFALDANYPNPFNPTTVISYSIPTDGNVTLVVHDVLGNEVAVLENGFKSAGKYSVTFNATNLTSGFYFYTVKSGKFFETKKMMLIK